MSNRENSVLSVFALFLAVMVFLLLVTSTVPMPKYRALEARVRVLEAQQAESRKEQPPSKWDMVLREREQDLELELEGAIHTKDTHELHEFLDGKEW